MKIKIEFDKDSGVNPTEFVRQLEEWVYDWLDVDEELNIELEEV